MPSYLQKLRYAFKAARELGLESIGLYAWYKLGLLSGLLRLQTGNALRHTNAIPAGTLNTANLPTANLEQIHMLTDKEARTALIARCEEIRLGRTRIFAGQPAEIIAPSPTVLRDWTAVDTTMIETDIKYLWEPARFGWAYRLAQAYTLFGEDHLVETFFSLCERFFTTNPPYRGIQWVSAQEVAIRLIAMAFAARSFAAGKGLTHQQQDSIACWIADHAARIPPTLAYARAQNNNHLLSEAVGLLTAGALLPDHPHAESWRSSGWEWLQKGLLSQITETGGYVQQSTNYHRLMLQIVLWAAVIGEKLGCQWDTPVLARLQASVKWLAALVDPHTGRTPNLGPNDGALLFPLSQSEFEDFRPTLQAAQYIFFGHPLYPPGPWDDFSAWLGILPDTPRSPGSAPARGLQPLTLQHPELDSWCYLRTNPQHIRSSFKNNLSLRALLRSNLRSEDASFLGAARFSGRPGHADQLHLDLWWRGRNIALDPGTYLYNHPSPWDNALTHTSVHNTVTVDGHEQMLRAGRFLYVDRAHAEIIKAAPDQLSAFHDGYRQFNLKHQRTVKALPEGWQVTDEVLPLGRKMVSPHSIELHWQLPDWPWSIDESNVGFGISLDSPDGVIRLEITTHMKPGEKPLTPHISLVRAGEYVHGTGSNQPTWGWVSPHYGLKLPALAVCCQVVGTPPITLRTQWVLPL